MNVIVNGEETQVSDDSTVLSLLESLGLQPGATVAQLNDQILAREDFATTEISDGDVLELVRFVGGG